MILRLPKIPPPCSLFPPPSRNTHFQSISQSTCLLPSAINAGHRGMLFNPLQPRIATLICLVLLPAWLFCIPSSYFFFSWQQSAVQFSSWPANFLFLPLHDLLRLAVPYILSLGSPDILAKYASIQYALAARPKALRCSGIPGNCPKRAYMCVAVFGHHHWYKQL